VQTSQVRILLSPLKRFKQLKRFFFAKNLAGSPEALGLLSPLKLFKQLRSFFYSRIFLKIGKIKKHIFKIIQSITIILIYYFKKLK